MGLMMSKQEVRRALEIYLERGGEVEACPPGANREFARYQRESAKKYWSSREASPLPAKTHLRLTEGVYAGK
jgi:hypothetical protein